MPQLPKKNNLDYTPDGIIQANKQLSTIALNNMKNPLVDLDQNILKTLTSATSLNGALDEFSKMLLGLQSSFLKSKQEGARLVSSYEGRVRNENIEANMGDFGGRFGDAEEMLRQLNAGIARMRGDGRTKGARNKKPSKKAIENIQRNTIYDFFGTGGGEPSRYVPLPVNQFTQRSLTSGAVADGYLEDVDDNEGEGSVIGSDDFDYNSDSDDSGGGGGGGGGGGDGGSDDDSSINTIFKNNQEYTDVSPEKALTSLLLDITKQIRYMDLLLISKIKPAVQQLNANQLNTLASAYKTLTSIWTEFQSLTIGKPPKMITLKIVDYLADVIPFGSQILKILQEELDKLKLDLLIVVNSFKQNEAIQPPNFIPNTFWDNSSVREMEGAGRSFTGKNMSGRDIPTIFRGALKDCAYKYML
jgi:hypothetical protein